MSSLVSQFYRYADDVDQERVAEAAREDID